MTKTSPSEVDQAMCLDIWGTTSSQITMNSALVADKVFEWTWNALSKQAQEQGVTLRGKQQLSDEIVNKTLQYLTDVEGKVARLIKGRTP